MALMLHEADGVRRSPGVVGSHDAVSYEASLAGLTVLSGPCSGRWSVRRSRSPVEPADRALLAEAADAAGLRTGSGDVVRLLAGTSPGSGDVVGGSRHAVRPWREFGDIGRIALYGRTPAAFRALVDVLTGTASGGGTLPGRGSRRRPARLYPRPVIETGLPTGPVVDARGVAFAVSDPGRTLRRVRLVQEIGLPARAVEFLRMNGRWRRRIPQGSADRLGTCWLHRDDGSVEVGPDPGNPRRVGGVFGDKSVVEFPGYVPPAWLSAVPRRVRPVLGRRPRSGHAGDRIGLDGALGWIPATSRRCSSCTTARVRPAGRTDPVPRRVRRRRDRAAATRTAPAAR